MLLALSCCVFVMVTTTSLAHLDVYLEKYQENDMIKPTRHDPFHWNGCGINNVKPKLMITVTAIE